MRGIVIVPERMGDWEIQILIDELPPKKSQTQCIYRWIGEPPNVFGGWLPLNCMLVDNTHLGHILTATLELLYTTQVGQLHIRIKKHENEERQQKKQPKTDKNEL